MKLDRSESDSVSTVTVVVPMRNEEAYIAKCLRSIVEQNYPKDNMEVLVVDGLSDDRSREIVEEVRREHPFIRLLDNPHRIVPTAMNIGIKEAEGEVIIRVDGHCCLAPDYISQCVRYLEETGVACVGGAIESIGQTPMARAISLAMSSPFGVGNAYFRYAQEERYVDTLAFGAYKREVFNRIGLFDEELVRNQDYELNYRLRKAGGKILLTPAIKSRYYTRSSLTKLWSQYFQYGFWKMRMLQKHPCSVRVRQLVPPYLVLILLLSGALSAISSLAAWVFALMVASYLSLSLAFSFYIAARKSWRYLPILPVIFACLHLSWGLGFLYSLAQLAFQWLVRRGSTMHSSRLPLQISERKTLLILMDGVLVNVATLAALWLGARRSGWPFTLEFLLSRFYWFLGLTALYFILARVNDCYNLKVASDALSNALALFKTTVQMLVIYFSLYFLAEPRTLPAYWPRHIIGFYGLVSIPLLSLWRWLYIVVFTAPQFRRRALIVGAGWAGRTIAEAIHDNLSVDYEIVGFIDDDPHKQGQTIEGIPVLGNHSKLVTLTEKMDISEIVLSITRDVSGDMFQAIMDCNERGIQITPMPILHEQMTGRVAVEHVGNNWFVVLPIDGVSAFSPFMLLKRLADVLVSVVGLIFLLALLPFVALAMYLESPGPIFYSQERVGRAGRTFQLIKLRSMVPDAEQDGQPRWAEEKDERVTRVGRFLRRTRLDELPQCLNVLRSEMSLIGPRPERPEFVADLQKRIPFYRSRLAVRPGLTGWAQVNYHYGSSVEDALVKLQYDLYYIKHQSLYLDLLILLKTIGVVLSFHGT